MILVALGGALAGLDPVVIVGLTAVAVAIVALVERASARAARAPVAERLDSSPPTEVAEAPRDEQPLGPVTEAESDPEPEPAVSERAARAILATGPPPVVEAARPRPEPEPEAEAAEPEPVAADEQEPTAEAEQPESEPIAELAAAGPAREWSIWDLERIAREHPEHPRQEEWLALILSLREFARADGMLSVDFDPLVRESFAILLVAEATAPETAAAP